MSYSFHATATRFVRLINAAFQHPKQATGFHA